MERAALLWSAPGDT